MTTAEILEKAAEYIEENGWNQRNYYYRGNPEAKPACLIGAIARVEGIDPVALHTSDRGSISAIYSHLGEASKWNDAPGRTQEEVCQMLRTVAAKLETPQPIIDRDPGDEGECDPNWEIRQFEPASG